MNEQLVKTREDFLNAANGCTPYVTYDWTFDEHRAQCHHAYFLALEYIREAFLDKAEPLTEVFRFVQWWVDAYLYRVGKYIHGEMN